MINKLNELISDFSFYEWETETNSPYIKMNREEIKRILAGLEEIREELEEC